MNKTELQVKRKTMEKLKLYGKKEEGDMVLVAAVYFDEKKKLIIDSEYPRVKRELTKEVEWLSFAIGWSESNILRHIFNKVRTSTLGDFVISERKITDERLEFSGRKLSECQYIATVLVDKNKKIVVEAIDEKIKEDLLDAIYDPDAPDEPPVFTIRGGAPTEELRKIEEEERKRGIFKVWATHVRPGDPDFLVGLFFGVERRMEQKRHAGWAKVGDYYIWSHEIVEE